jgi:hypothetical protein
MSTRLPAFDVLLDLARNDPEGLEELRQSLTTSIIDAASNEANRRRLRGLQFRVDMERERAKTPLAATIRISELMCQSMAELHRTMVTTTEIELTEVIGPDFGIDLTDTSKSGATGARILPFRRL